jgi:hypothetical protein
VGGAEGAELTAAVAGEEDISLLFLDVYLLRPSFTVLVAVFATGTV